MRNMSKKQDITRQALMKYVNSATDLAESVKRNITKSGIIDNKTVLALNEFIIASNAIADLTSQLTMDTKDPNTKLN